MPMKPSTLETVKEFLEKARRRLNDENPDYSDMDEEPDQEELDSEEGEGNEEDDATKWLASHNKGDEADSEAVSEPQEETEVAPVVAKQPEIRRKGVKQDQPAREPSDDELQPSKEELMRMREYTRPWEQRARDREKLLAEPTVNPKKHAEGHLVEARNTSHADYAKALQEMESGPEFKNADPITQMEMSDKFKTDWHKQNPEHLMNALTAHHEAHKKGAGAMQAFNQTKDEKIRHIASGGAQPDAVSLEEGMQHAGGSREDEDSAPSGIQQDKAAQFAGGNQEFINQYMKNYKGKGASGEPQEFDPGQRADVNTVLGDHPAFKDKAKKRQFDAFMNKYHPLIEKASRQVLAKLGLTEKARSGQIDERMLHEAGMHGLFQAINDYDHDHPSKAKFTTHLNRRMHGLMQTALKMQDEIPETLRAGAKQFDKQRRAENAAPVKHTNKEGVTNTIMPPSPRRPAAEIAAEHHPDVADRLKRVAAAKAPVIRHKAATAPTPAAPKPAGPKMTGVRNIAIDEEE